MTQQEAMKCRQAAQLYRALKQENERLRQELEERNRLDLRMDTEDAQVIAIVNGKRPERRPDATDRPTKPVFDFDTAKIEPIDTRFAQRKHRHHVRSARIRFYSRFALFLIVECVVWIAHHLGWVNLLTAMTITVFLFLLTNYLGLFR